MAHLTAVTNRHVWKRTLLMEGMTKRAGIICTNCRAFRFGEDPERPVTGCSTSVDLSRAGNSRLGDHRNHEMARRADVNARERADDLAMAQGRSTPQLDAYLARLQYTHLDEDLD
jgi:hypothetical protein